MSAVNIVVDTPASVEHGEARAAYLGLALASGDGYFAIDALGAIACAYGMERVATEADMTMAELIDCFDSRHVLDVVRFLKIASIVGLTITTAKS